MEKLTIEHLAPYLPYGLTVKFRNGSIERMDMVGDEIIHCFNIKGTSGHNWPIGFDDVKPLLIPLSELTLSIGEINPLLSLTKMALTQIWGDTFELKVINIVRAEIGGGIIAESDPQYRIGFSVDFENGQRDFKLTINSQEMMLDKLVLFQKLFEWHFDVFGLIEKGLAINKLTV